MIYSMVALRHYYAANPMVHVAGNNSLYYEEGNPRKVISPDIYVVYGVRTGCEKPAKSGKKAEFCQVLSLS